MLRLRIWILVAAGILLIGGPAWLAATPYLATTELRAAVTASDREGISRMVDFQLLRENLRRGLSEETNTMAENAWKKGTLAGVGTDLGLTMVRGFANLVIDILVTPDGVATLIRGGMLGSQEPPGYGLQYRSLNRVVIVVKGSEEPSLVMTRNNLWSPWKVTDVEDLSKLI